MVCALCFSLFPSLTHSVSLARSLLPSISLWHALSLSASFSQLLISLPPSRSLSLAYSLASSLHLSLTRSLAIILSLPGSFPRFFSPSLSRHSSLSFSLARSLSFSLANSHSLHPPPPTSISLFLSPTCLWWTLQLLAVSSRFIVYWECVCVRECDPELVIRKVSR